MNCAYKEFGCLFVRDVRIFPPDAIADPPPQFAQNIVQRQELRHGRPGSGGYFADILQLTLGATVELDFSRPWCPFRAEVAKSR